MTFQRWDYEFDGPYTDPNRLQPSAGVYVVWCMINTSWFVLDVGESEDVVDRLNNHDRAECWRQNCNGTIFFSATYISDEQDRFNLEQSIRNSVNVPCGER